ncbi:MAG: LPS export ABC transporter periplasmic protein LptC [Phycisphaerae bacterium]|nr:LPS export ABC transporter periplasmic protein LptC [Gemmatimonadaceae bacterium]
MSCYAVVLPSFAQTARIPRVLMLVVSALVLWTAGCKPKPAAIAAKALVLPDSAEQMIFGFNALITDNGVSKGRLLADTAYLYRDPPGPRFELRRVNLTFFTPQGVDDGTMSAREGTYIDWQKRVEGRGNVIIIRKDGNRVESPQLVYDQGRNQIFSDSSFKFTQPNKRMISGTGFESDPRLTNLRCMRNCNFSGNVQVPRQ